MVDSVSGPVTYSFGVDWSPSHFRFRRDGARVVGRGGPCDGVFKPSPEATRRRPLERQGRRPRVLPAPVRAPSAFTDAPPPPRVEATSAEEATWRTRTPLSSGSRPTPAPPDRGGERVLKISTPSGLFRGLRLAEGWGQVRGGPPGHLGAGFRSSRPTRGSHRPPRESSPGGVGPAARPET